VKRFLALAAAATMVLASASFASAAGRPGSGESFTYGDAAIIGPVHVRGGVAEVHVRYSCTTGTHLWVSVKQSATREIDSAVSAEGSGFGGAAAAWWQSHRGSFTCDGERHVAWFTVDTVEPGSRGQLQSGWSWAQFCVTTETGLSAIRMAWTRVVDNS
jgi:opacity protein-like surface antigen